MDTITVPTAESMSDALALIRLVQNPAATEDLLNRLNDHLKEFVARKSEAEAKEASAAAREGSVSARESSVAAREASASAREAKVAEGEKAVAIGKQLLADAQAQLAYDIQTHSAKEADLATRTVALTAHGKAMDDRMQQRESELLAREAALSAARSALSARESRLKELVA
jgi:hypothetical protein